MNDLNRLIVEWIAVFILNFGLVGYNSGIGIVIALVMLFPESQFYLLFKLVFGDFYDFIQHIDRRTMQ